MEPVFMVLGQSAATAAVLAMESHTAVQKVEYAKLRERLLRDHQVLELAARPRKGGIDPKTLTGVVLDDDQAQRQGFEAKSSSAAPFVGEGYRHDGGEKDGKQSATYTPDLPTAGKYEVRVCYSPNPNRATNVPAIVTHADGATTLMINQQKTPPLNGVWLSLGTFAFAKGTGGKLTITNKDVNGYVIIDAVQWLPVK